MRQRRAVDRAAELLRWLGVGVVRIRVVGRDIAIRTPVPLVLAGIGVEDGNAPVAVPIGDDYFVCLGEFRRTPLPR